MQNETMETTNVRYFTRDLLETLNNLGKLDKRKNTIDANLITQLNPNQIYPVLEHIEDCGNFQVTVVLDSYGNMQDIDLTTVEWNNLPTKTLAEGQ